MTQQQAITILINHQHWRRCNDDNCKCEQQDSAEIGRALDVAINALSESVMLKHIIHKRNTWLLQLHELTNHNKLGKSYLSADDISTINRINHEIKSDLMCDEWEM